MGVVVAHGTVHLAHELHGRDLLAAALQAHHHVGHFLAHGGGAGGLAVGAAEHGHFGKLVRHLAQLGDQAIQARQDHLGACPLELQGMAGVVDVFAGAGKVHKLGRFLQLWAVFELGLDPVLDGFDIVVGGLLELFDGQGIGFAEVLDQTRQISACTRCQGLEFGKAGIGQGDEPSDFDLNTAVHITLLTHERPQGIEFAGITAIQRRQSGNGGEIHPSIVIPAPDPTDSVRMCPPHDRNRFRTSTKSCERHQKQSSASPRIRYPFICCFF